MKNLTIKTILTHVGCEIETFRRSQKLTKEFVYSEAHVNHRIYAEFC